MKWPTLGPLHTLLLRQWNRAVSELFLGASSALIHFKGMGDSRHNFTGKIPSHSFRPKH